MLSSFKPRRANEVWNAATEREGIALEVARNGVNVRARKDMIVEDDKEFETIAISLLLSEIEWGADVQL